MNKAAIVQSIIEALREDFENRQRSSRQTRSAGNDAETKAEGKYDTRSTEENYLADGLARQAFEAAEAAAAFEKLDVRAFETGEEIDQGALVLVGFAGEDEWFFLGPAGGGIEVQADGVTVTVITPESPLGAKLLGRSVGAKLTAPQAEVRKVL